MSQSAVRRRIRLDPEERRPQLLACSLAVFAECGIARATHSQVAVRAGVSVSAVYAYFRTRADLVAATLTEVEAYLDRMFESVITKRLTAYETLLEIAETFAEGTRTIPDLIMVWLDWSTGVGLDSWPRYLELLERMHLHIDGKLAEGKRLGQVPAHLDTRAAARLYVGGGHTIALMQCAGIATAEMDVFIQQLVRGALGIAADAPIP
jgi:TetR/AcrR family hemagglutinin/protease transcriptional regulator